jgi:O6-methylguanine-DNA--protein-cysteine methyltransferase
MADVKISIEPLNGKNYAVWSQRMEMLLVHKKLWKGVTEPEADVDRSAEAKALIGLNVTEQYLGSVVAARNAKQAWDELENVFKGKTTTWKTAAEKGADDPQTRVRRACGKVRR